MSVTTEQLIMELNKRNLKLEHIMEYIKFEDDCIEKGFTFNSLIEAREKQIPRTMFHYGNQTLCKCGHEVKVFNDYCCKCGQKLDWGD